ncbi:hypothetical protein ORA50_07705 [Pseudomonas carnis]|nr:hypothetical protein [Pseudomonas carnis]MDW8840117.1 hypothetical protein [Pseudomonas carnis]
MSEVKRYHVTEAGLVEGSALGRINVVLGADFDQVTARLKEGITKHWQIVCDQRAKIDALQALLTAADERADVLEGLLQTINAKASKSHISQSLWRLKTDMANIAQVTEAALKPAEGRNEPNCLRCLDKKTVPSNLAEGYVMDCPDCCSEEG